MLSASPGLHPTQSMVQCRIRSQGMEFAMREARINGRIVEAGPDAPDVAQCPECGHEVIKRSRRTMDKTVTWYYRHAPGASRDCPRRYHPVRR